MAVGVYIFEMKRPMEATRFRRALAAWNRNNGRDLPWRRTRDPYAIVVSEFMLQQTQVATVVPYYIEWLRRFPDFAALAAARQSDVLHAWQGLGYYSRARNLHVTAKAVMRQHAGKFPRAAAAAQALPGIGRYTANAIATFAFDESRPVVEANIARLLARVFDLQLSIDSTAGRNALWSIAEALLPKRGAGVYNSALMDVGATVCAARQPKCDACPVKRFCRARDPLRLPMKRNAQPMKRLAEHHGFSVRGGKILLEQSATRWRGMWILPRLRQQARGRVAMHRSVFPFTNHTVTLSVFNHSPRVLARSCHWFAVRDLSGVAIPSPHRRAIDALISTLDVRR